MPQTYGALCALAEQHGVVMTEQVRALLRDVEKAGEQATQAPFGRFEFVTNEHRAALFFMLKLTEAVPLRDVIEATSTVQTMIDYYTRLANEYEVREDGKLMRKDRWETGFRNIATILQGPRGGFEVEEIVEKVRALKLAAEHAADPAGAETVDAAPQMAERQASALVLNDPIYQVLVEDPDVWRDVTAGEYDERQPSSRRKVHLAPKVAPKCWCYACNKDRVEDGFPYVMTRMIVCPSCGNKRCPRATDHNLACTDSNEPGQPGSRYGTNLLSMEKPL